MFKSILYMLCSLAVITADVNADAAADIKALTGRHTRLVWSECHGNSSDIYCMTPIHKLVGIDTEDGQGIRVIRDTLDAYTKPLITPNGDRVIYSNYNTKMVYIINWDGTGHRPLVPGAASDVWQDPTSEVEYVIVSTPVSGTNSTVMRYRIDDPSDSLLLWNKTKIGYSYGDNRGVWFQLSGDGKRAAGGFPWPACGTAFLPNSSWRLAREGCWPSMAPDDSYTMWVFGLRHRTAHIYDKDNNYTGDLDLHAAPGISGWEVFHPKWSNHPDFITMTGPYDGGEGGVCITSNCGQKLTSGGTRQNLYLGRLNAARTQVTGWVRVTANDIPEFYGDAWLEPEEETSAAPAIINQPVSQTVFAGDRAVLSVGVSGYPAPSFQWRKDGADLPGADEDTYIIDSAAATDAGRYTVSVTNTEGSVVSDTAILSVEQTTINTDLLLHYGFEGGQTDDQAGDADAAAYGAVASSDAIIGSGSYSFDGIDDYLTPGSPTGFGSIFPYTFSLWVKPARTGGVLLAISDSRWFWGKALTLQADGAVQMTVGKTSTHNLSRSAAGAVTTGVWQHIAVTHTHPDTTARIFVNGTEVAYDSSSVGSGRLQNGEGGPFMVGGATYSGGTWFAGLIDDVRIYSEALSPSMISALHGIADVTGAAAPLPVYSNAGLFPAVLSSSRLAGMIRNFGNGTTVEIFSGTGQQVIAGQQMVPGIYYYTVVKSDQQFSGRIIIIR